MPADSDRISQGEALAGEGLDHPRLRPVEAHPVELEGRQVIALHDPQHFAGSAVCLSPEAASLLALFDGRNSLLDIQAAFARRYGSLLFREQLLQLIHSLDENFLLDSPRFARHRAAVEADFRRAPARPAILAGKSYPAEPGPLRQFLEGLFAAPEGPRDTAPSASAGRLVGLVVPHIDFARGGTCYAWGYREAAGLPAVDRWLVLGTVHAPIARPFALTTKPFETPLGRVETDAIGLERLLTRVGATWLEDEIAHRTEHSIEFQAVFLRHCIPPDRPLAILPILCGAFPDDGGATAEAGEFLAALSEILASLPGRTMVMASADLAHVGPQFGDPWQVTPGRLGQIEAADREMLATVEAGDPEGFFRSVMRDGDARRICGLPPIYALLRLLPGAQGRLLKYGQWPDPNGTVTFATLGVYATT